jgi:rod shape-determining protein MreD
MAWGLFLLALILTFLLQTTVTRFLGAEWLDLLLTLALLCGLAAPPVEGRLAAWFTGLARDVGTDAPFGLHAFMLGLAVLVLTQLREMVNQQLWWVRWLIAFLVAFPTQLLLRMHQRFLQGDHQSWFQMIGRSFATAIVAGLLVAVILALPGLMRRRRRRRITPRL